MFHLNKSGVTGLASRCKSCTKQYFREYYLKNSERINKNVKSYDSANKKSVQSRQATWRRNNVTPKEEEINIADDMGVWFGE